MIGLDSSALVAIVNREPEREAFLRIIEASNGCAISALTVLETRMVVLGRFGQPGLTDLSVLFDEIGPDIVPFDADHCDAAFRAFQQYGKGMGTAAKLNMGDCASYALAKTLGVPLLFKGNDFTATDITPAT